MKESEDECSAIAWSFDIEDARQHLLSAGDDLSTVIRAHLYVEHVLIEYIQVTLPHPGCLNVDRLNFPTKLELCLALGAVPEDLGRPLKLVNSLRNKAAHKLEHEVSIGTKKELFEALPSIARELVFRDGVIDEPGPIGEVPIGRILLVILVLLEGYRHSYAEGLAQKKIAEQRLRDAVDNLRRVQANANEPS